MSLLLPLLFLLAAALLTLFAYVDRLYAEMGKFFLRGVQDNLEVFEKEVEPALKMDRGRATVTFALLTQSMILILAVLTGYLVFHQQALAWGVSKKVHLTQRADNLLLLYWVSKDPQ